MTRFPVDLDTVAVWKSELGLHSDEELAAAESDWRYILDLAEVDDEYPDHVNENSGVNAASALAAIDAIRAQRARYGIAKPSSSLGWPREFLDEVKGSVRLEGLIQQHIALHKRGASYAGRCPFHNDKSPSLIVWPDSQRWRCFGCGMAGDAITWEQAISRLEFKEAVFYLAAIGNVDVPDSKRSPRQKGALRVA